MARIEVEDVEPERRAGLIALSAWVSARTRFLDDLLLDATNQGVGQVVLLGAGLDARAFRLPWPGEVRVFELDTAAMLDFKQRGVDGIDAQPRAQRVVIRIDLREDWPGPCAPPGSTPTRPWPGWSRACSSTSTRPAWSASWATSARSRRRAAASA